ncbi:beta-galactosidase [Planctomycetota bacterium]|nr:beta-galactosidase [Planctomycetota bacterium]
MRFGCAWYPEHWPRQRWAEDLRLMRDCGMNTVRIGEFAWSRMEPVDGRFALDWLGEAIDLAASFGIDSVLCTPSATPPAWLTSAHPEVLAVRADGRPEVHGMRCHYRPGSPLYRWFCKRINSALAERFGQHPAVLGWQIDNEHWQRSHDPDTLARFAEWCRARYGSLDALNDAWSASYWSQEYSDWSQLHAPPGSPNPGLRLAWHRFSTALTAEFQAGQVQTLRERIAQRQWITHNFHPHDDLDRAGLVDGLDFASWDAYAVDGPSFDPAQLAVEVERIRSLTPSRKVWIMETQPGSVNWKGTSNPTMQPGELRAAAWHMAAHGAEAVLYWQWRSAPGGQEQYHGTVVAQDGHPRPHYTEIARIGEEFKRLTTLLDQSAPVHPVAVIDRWADRFAIKHQRHHHQFDPAAHVRSWYAAVQRQGLSADLVERLGDQRPWSVVIAPQVHLADQPTIDRLRAFVIGGGHLLIGPRSCFKDDENALLAQRQPGPLSDLAGAQADDFYALETPVPLGGELGEGTASIFAERIGQVEREVAVWARYGQGHGWLAGQPAIIHRPTGKGSLTWCACWPDQELQRRLIARISRLAGIESSLIPPDGVTIVHRRGESGSFRVFINHTAQPQQVELGAVATERLSGTTASNLVLAPWDVAVVG